MMAYIHQQNQKKKHPHIHMPLSGAAIGNGWFDPYHQYGVQEAAYGHGILGRAQKYALDEKERACQAAYDADVVCPEVCEELYYDVTHKAAGTGAPYLMSSYDVRKFETKNQPRVFPLGHKVLEAYLGGWDTSSPTDQQPNTIGVLYTDILKALHASPSDRIAGQRWESCSDPPADALGNYDNKGVTQEIVNLLDAGIPMLFYNGVYDLVCNHVGNEKALEHLEWKHQSDFLLAKGYAWASPSDGNIAGYMKEYENLLFLKVLNAGHMVPMDVPLPALDMIQTFMYHKSFQTFEQKIKPKAAPEHSCPVCSISGDTTQMEGRPSWMFALLGIVVGLACSYLVTRIQRRPLRFTPVDHMDAEGMEMRSIASIS
jgi:carboxypeptidase D